jgi:hypothetical protein
MYEFPYTCSNFPLLNFASINWPFFRPATIQHFLAVQAGNQGLSCSWAKTESQRLFESRTGDLPYEEVFLYRSYDLTTSYHRVLSRYRRTPEYMYTEGNGDAFSRAEGRIILRPRTFGV